MRTGRTSISSLGILPTESFAVTSARVRAGSSVVRPAHSQTRKILLVVRLIFSPFLASSPSSLRLTTGLSANFGSPTSSKPSQARSRAATSSCHLRSRSRFILIKGTCPFALVSVIGLGQRYLSGDLQGDGHLVGGLGLHRVLE